MKTTKKCTHCNQIKDIAEFYKQKQGKCGVHPWCKDCFKSKARNYYRTKEGIITSIYAHQLKSSKRRGHKPPAYSNKELREWVFLQPLFHKLYDEWVNSGYDKWATPSVDRIHDDIHYCIENIQIMTWKENKTKFHSDVKQGKIITLHKAVLQYTKDGKFLAEYFSIHEAGNQTGIWFTNISHACNGNAKSAGGYIWKHKDSR